MVNVYPCPFIARLAGATYWDVINFNAKMVQSSGAVVVYMERELILKQGDIVTMSGFIGIQDVLNPAYLVGRNIIHPFICMLYKML